MSTFLSMLPIPQDLQENFAQKKLNQFFQPWRGKVSANTVKKIREAQMMSKAELARKAEVTVQTIDRIEKGNDCRLDTKRKIIQALGFKLTDRTKIFIEEDHQKE